MKRLSTVLIPNVIVLLHCPRVESLDFNQPFTFVVFWTYSTHSIRSQPNPSARTARTTMPHVTVKNVGTSVTHVKQFTWGGSHMRSSPSIKSSHLSGVLKSALLKVQGSM